MKSDSCVPQQGNKANKYISLRGYFYVVVIVGLLLIITGIMSAKVTLGFSNLLENRSSDRLSLATSSSNMHDFDIMFSLLTHVFTFTMLIWEYQAYKNITILACKKSRWTPIWAVGFNFIPVLNLWRPWQVIQEIVYKSASEPLDQTKVGIYAATGWYGLLSVLSYMQWTALQMRELITYDYQWSELITAFRQMCYSSILYLLVIPFILWFIWRITLMQETKVKNLKL